MFDENLVNDILKGPFSLSLPPPPLPPPSPLINPHTLSPTPTLVALLLDSLVSPEDVNNAAGFPDYLEDLIGEFTLCVGMIGDGM
jgi:hypothetical protein